MKKLYVSLFFSFITLLSYAQNVFPENGNVGIGTSSPFSKLSIYPIYPSGINVASTFLIGERTVLGNEEKSYLYPFEVQHSNTGNIDRLQFAPYRRQAGYTWLGTAYRIQFAVDHSFTDGSKAFIEVGATDPGLPGGGFISLGTEGQDRLIISSRGYVGIGTTVPAEALSVNGNIRAKEIKVETNNWPDYVFKEDYQLLTLEELKTYINKNKHLPEIPSEQEMIEKGINLGEMNKLLVKKVEELTLYLIENKSEKTVSDRTILSLTDRISRLELMVEKLSK